MDPKNELFYPVLILLGIYVIAFSYAVYREYKEFKNAKEPDELIPFEYNPEKE